MTMAFKVILAFFNTSSLEKADTFPTQVRKWALYFKLTARVFFLIL